MCDTGGRRRPVLPGEQRGPRVAAGTDDALAGEAVCTLDLCGKGHCLTRFLRFSRAPDHAFASVFLQIYGCRSSYNFRLVSCVFFLSFKKRILFILI